MGNGLLKKNLPLVAALALLLIGPGEALARGGLIIGFDLGGATVSGDRNVPLKKTEIGLKTVYPLPQCANPTGFFEKHCPDSIRTDAGSGLAFGLRLGYNFFGYGGLETNVFGHGNMSSGGDKSEGVVNVGLLGRYFPLQHFPELRSRKYDPSIYFGWIFLSFMGYHQEYDPDNDGRGWEASGGTQFGAAFDYDVGKGVSLGLDLKFFMPFYDKHYISWEDNNWMRPVSDPDTFIFAPTATITFHLLDPEA